MRRDIIIDDKTYPDVTSDLYVRDDYIFSNNALKTNLSTILQTISPDHPLTGNVTNRAKNIAAYKEKDAMCTISFECIDAGEVLDVSRYGKVGNQIPRIKCGANNKVEWRRRFDLFYNYPELYNYRIVGKIYRDIFGGAKPKDDFELPNITVSFSDTSTCELNIVYIAKFYMTLEFSCKDTKIEISIPAFLNTNREPHHETIFKIEDGYGSFSKLKLTYSYYINETSTLRRTDLPSVFPSFNFVFGSKMVYTFVPLPGQIAPHDILANQDYRTPSPDVNDPDECKLPGIEGPVAERMNTMLKTYLQYRIDYLQKNIEKELDTHIRKNLIVNGEPQAEKCEQALNLLKSTCDTKIKVINFENTPSDNSYHGVSPWYAPTASDPDISSYVKNNKLTKINFKPDRYREDLQQLFNRDP